ncbi:hypothetical protein ACFYXM_28075 [Streptomyces sp. NPDC002476]|uniref:hypothetical protein n=1 Tax=Streptomyces sp. NPDC002476 TaxID=3364648 RepID=UPI0036B9CE26
MFISYSTQAMKALAGLAEIDRGAHYIALLRIQSALISLDDGVIDTTVTLAIDDDKYVIPFTAAKKGVEVTINELDWQVNGI